MPAGVISAKPNGIYHATDKHQRRCLLESTEVDKGYNGGCADGTFGTATNGRRSETQSIGRVGVGRVNVFEGVNVEEVKVLHISLFNLLPRDRFNPLFLMENIPQLRGDE